jgi:hypothetical protein
LVVPILVHSFYDFFTIFGTWLIASKEFKEGLKDTDIRYRVLPEEDKSKFEVTCRKVFDMMDINKDGTVDKSEFILARKLLG